MMHETIQNTFNIIVLALSVLLIAGSGILLLTVASKIRHPLALICGLVFSIIAANKIGAHSISLWSDISGAGFVVNTFSVILLLAPVALYFNRKHSLNA
jgi:hypothetical protein